MGGWFSTMGKIRFSCCHLSDAVLNWVIAIQQQAPTPSAPTPYASAPTPFSAPTPGAGLGGATPYPDSAPTPAAHLSQTPQGYPSTPGGAMTPYSDEEYRSSGSAGKTLVCKSIIFASFHLKNPIDPLYSCDSVGQGLVGCMFSDRRSK